METQFVTKKEVEEIVVKLIDQQMDTKFPHYFQTIREQFRDDMRVYFDMMKTLMDTVSVIQKDVAQLKEDVAVLQKDVAFLKGEVTEIKIRLGKLENKKSVKRTK